MLLLSTAYKERDRVEARWQGGSAWYPGVILNIIKTKRGNLFNIIYDEDKLIEHNVPRKYVRRPKNHDPNQFTKAEAKFDLASGLAEPGNHTVAGNEAGVWTCQQCTTNNLPPAEICLVCEAARAVNPVRAESWMCSQCQFINNLGDDHCEFCNATLKEHGVPTVPWECKMCTFVNQGKDSSCSICRTSRPIKDSRPIEVIFESKASEKTDTRQNFQNKICCPSCKKLISTNRNRHIARCKEAGPGKPKQNGCDSPNTKLPILPNLPREPHPPKITVGSVKSASQALLTAKTCQEGNKSQACKRRNNHSSDTRTPQNSDTPDLPSETHPPPNHVDIRKALAEDPLAAKPCQEEKNSESQPKKVLRNLRSFAHEKESVLPNVDFKYVWKELKERGWTWVFAKSRIWGPQTYHYLRPAKCPGTGTLGEDYFNNAEEVLSFLQEKEPWLLDHIVKIYGQNKDTSKVCSGLPNNNSQEVVKPSSHTDTSKNNHAFPQNGLKLTGMAESHPDTTKNKDALPKKKFQGESKHSCQKGAPKNNDALKEKLQEESKPSFQKVAAKQKAVLPNTTFQEAAKTHAQDVKYLFMNGDATAKPSNKRDRSSDEDEKMSSSDEEHEQAADLVALTHFEEKPRPNPPALLYVDEFSEIWKNAQLAEKRGKNKTIEKDPKVRGNKRQRGQNAMYGSVSAGFIAQLIEELKVSSTHCFIDVGSGLGQAVVQVASTVGCASIGVEIDEDRAKWAACLFDNFLQTLEAVYGNEARLKLTGLVDLQEGDFQLFQQKIQEANVIFVNNFGGWWRSDRQDPDSLKEPSLEQKLIRMVVEFSQIGTRLILLDKMIGTREGFFEHHWYESVKESFSWVQDPNKTNKVHVYTLKSREWFCKNCQYGNLFTSDECVKCNQKGPVPKRNPQV